MDKVPWLLIFNYILKGVGSAKGISKLTAKVIVKYVLAFSGPTGWITSLLLSKVLKYGIIELGDLRQEFKDKLNLKKFDKIKHESSKERDDLEEKILTGK